MSAAIRSVNDCEAHRMSSSDFSPATQPFVIDVHQLEGRSVVALTGELDLATAPELRERLGLLSEEGKNQVTLDLTHLDFVDSTGLSVFVMAFNRAQAGGGSLIIRNPSLPVMRIFEITGLTSVFTIASEEEPLTPAGA
jgi:anti-sigma B factor antagonist